uniref:Sodium channel protein Nach n=1 Tax=Timema cristinae TaxID=61476 RepID=A0A7R9DBZ4_TIMCR|nr:unnamed protein product [Timema cristinae]
MTNERFIPAGGETLISLYPSVYYTTREANFVSPERRGCILTEERSVQTTVKYTFNNCFVECRQNYTFELCGCSPYYYPSSDKIDATCPKFGKRYLPDAGVDVPCDCLPECTDVTYEVDMSESFITKNFSSSLHDVNDGVDSKNHSILHVYFMDLVGTRYRRDVYYNWHKLLASFGGILGLFLGFSMMTGFEMVYHFTVRVFFYLLSSRRSSADTSSSYVPPTSFRERSGLRSTRGNILGTFNETASYWPPQVTTLQENNLSYPRVTAGNEIPSTSAGTFEFNKPSSAKRSKLSKRKKTASAAHLSIITE